MTLMTCRLGLGAWQPRFILKYWDWENIFVLLKYFTDSIRKMRHLDNFFGYLSKDRSKISNNGGQIKIRCIYQDDYQLVNYLNICYKDFAITAELKHLPPLSIYNPDVSRVPISVSYANVHHLDPSSPGQCPPSSQNTRHSQNTNDSVTQRGTGAGPKTSLIKLDGKSNLLLKMASSSS